MGSLSKKKPALPSILLLLALTALGQNPQPQSTIRTWMEQGKLKQINGRNDEALLLFTKAQSLATRHSLYPELCEAKIKIGEIIYDHGHYDSALTWFRQADSIAETHALPSAHSYSLYYMGKYNETKRNFQQAKIYYDSALTICRQNKDLRQLALDPAQPRKKLSQRR